MSRLPLVPDDSVDAVLAPIFDRFRTTGRPVPALYRTLGNAPTMLAGWTAFAWSLRNDATTDRGLRELAIMRVAQLTGSQYEWQAHWPMAEGYGMSREQLAALRNWSTSRLFTDDQRLVLSLTDELTQQLEVTDPTWERLSARYRAPELVELLLTVAFYSCVSRVLAAFRLPPEDSDDDVIALM